MNPKISGNSLMKEAVAPRPPSQGVSLHIERLVIDGIPLGAGHAGKLQTTIVTELTRLLTEGGLAHPLSRGTATPSLRTAPVKALSSRPSQLGIQIAEAVYGSLRQ